MEVIYVVLGLPLNMWLLCALVSFKQQRASLRNKLWCGLLAANVIETVYLSADLIKYFSGGNGRMSFEIWCSLYMVSYSVDSLLEFFSNCTCVSILATYLVNLLGLHRNLILTPLRIKVMNIAIPVAPVVLWLLMFPAILVNHGMSFSKTNCIFHTYNSYFIYTVLSTVVPVGLSILLLIACIVQNRRQCHSSDLYCDEMTYELFGGKGQTDKLLPYIVLVCTVIFLDIPSFGHIMWFDQKTAIRD